RHRAPYRCRGSRACRPFARRPPRPVRRCWTGPWPPPRRWRHRPQWRPWPSCWPPGSPAPARSRPGPATARPPSARRSVPWRSRAAPGGYGTGFGRRSKALARLPRPEFEDRPPEEGGRMRIINLTPHAVTIDGVTFPPDGRIPRLREETREVGQIEVDGHTLPVTETVLGELEGLPDPADGVIYIVSRLVAEAAPARDDLYFPGRLLRDEAGRVVGAESLARLPRQRRETIVVSTRAEQGNVESVRVTVAPAVADALRSLGERL